MSLITPDFGLFFWMLLGRSGGFSSAPKFVEGNDNAWVAYTREFDSGCAFEGGAGGGAVVQPVRRRRRS